MATYAEMMSDPFSEHWWLVDLDYYDTVNLTTGTLYYSTTKYGTESDAVLVSQLYEPRLMNGYNFVASAQDFGQIGGLLPARDGGTIVLAQYLGDLDGLRLYSFGGRNVTIRHGGNSPKYGVVAYDDCDIVFKGEADGQALVGIDTVTIKLRNLDSRFEFPIQDRLYTGGDYWLHFDGNRDYVTCGATANATSHLDFTSGAFSIEFFTYVESIGVQQVIMSRGSVDNDGWVVRLSDTGRIVLITNQAGVNQKTLSGIIPTNKRIHVAITRSGTGALIYIDGVLNVSSYGTHTNPLTSARLFYLGCAEPLVDNFTGYLDEVRIWGTARTETQINLFKDKQLQAADITTTEPRFYSKVDDGTLSVLSDSSSYTGKSPVACTITNATWHPSLQGGEELEGTSLPDVWGLRLGVIAPVPVYQQGLVYHVHSGSVYEMTSVMAGGLVLPYDTVTLTTYTSMSAFLDNGVSPAKTTPGCYERLVTQHGSWIRLGSAPNFPVTMTIKGDNTGGTGYGDASTYRSKASDIVRYIICNRGPQPLIDPTDIDDAAFDTLAAACTQSVGTSYIGDKTVAEVIHFLLGGVGATGWFSRGTNIFTVLKYTGTATIDPGGIGILTEKQIEEDTLEPIDVGPPVWGVNFNYRKNDIIHSTSDIAASVIAASPPNTTNWRVLLSENRTVGRRNKAVRTAHTGATILTVDSSMQVWTESAVEADRLLALYGNQGQCFRAFFDQEGVQYDRMDYVILHFQDGNAYGSLQNRLGTADDVVFVVLAVEDDVENGGTWLTLYREAVS